MNLYDTIKEMRKEGLSWNVIAGRVKSIRNFDNGEALRSWFRRERSRSVNSELEGVKTFSDTVIPVALAKPFENVLEVTLADDKTALVLSDIHVPYHHEEFIQQAIESAEFDMIVVAGDLFTFDQISKYSKAHNIPRMETELEIGGAMLLYLAQHAPVYITNSNHDARFANRIDAQFSLKRLMNAALNGRKPQNPIITTERDYIFMNDNFIIGHLNNASGVAGKIAHNIAQKYQRHCLAGHDHITGVFNPRSRFIGASIGCSADYTKFWYSEKGMSPIKFMQRGYATVTGCGTIKLYDEASKLYYQRDTDGITYRSILIDRP